MTTTTADTTSGHPTDAAVDHAEEVLSALTGLIRTSRAIGRRLQEEGSGASGTPVAVLKALARADGHDRPGDLAVAAGVAPSVVSRVLPRLEDDGLVLAVRVVHDAACGDTGVRPPREDRLPRSGTVRGERHITRRRCLDPHQDPVLPGTGLAQPGPNGAPRVGIAARGIAIRGLPPQKMSHERGDEDHRVALPSGGGAHLGEHVRPGVSLE